MANDPESLKIANDSGFPLQIAVGHQVKSTISDHGWRVRYAEHSWVNKLDDQRGFIDLVLQNSSRNAFLILECKRTKDATWLFMREDGGVVQRRQAKAWVTTYTGSKYKFFGWYDVPADPRSPEALFCSVRGQTTNDRNTMLERIGGELISSTEALANEDRDYRDTTPLIRLYFNVVVTTARLKVAKFAPSDISLVDGTISSADIQEVPYLRFRKQMSMREWRFSPEDYANQISPDDMKENSIFVVRADALVDCLKECEVDQSTWSSFV